MRSRLLMSAAILVAGVAIASAQYAPGSAGQERNQLRKQERGQDHRQDHRAPDAAAHKSAAAAHKAPEQLRARTAGSSFQDSTKKGVKNVRENSQHATAKSYGKSLPLQTSQHPHNARSDLLPPTKHNDASAQPARSQRGRGTAGDRSVWDRTTAQGRVQAEQGHRIGQSDRQGSSRSSARTGHREPASAVAKDRGRQGVALKEASHRKTGRASEQKPHSTHKLARHVAPHPGQHRGGASQTGQAEIRKIQVALNQQGFDVGHADGKLGQHTKAALIAFQKQRGFHTTGKVDHETLHALIAGRTAPGGIRDNNQNQQGAEKGIAPSQPAPQAVEPSTTGQSGAASPPTTASPQPSGAETPAEREGLQMPESGASGRVPAGSPQEDYQDGEVRSESDQR